MNPVNPPRTSSTRALLFVVCLAQFMVILDVAVVNVALPSMRDALGFSTGGLQWVVNAYTLTFAGFMMLGGRCADLLGRRRVFLAGILLFAVSSLLCALASSRGMLIGARALQGLGGAIVSPATLSIIMSALPPGRERNRGLAAWATVASLGASSGALLGGVLTQALGWPAIFAVNVPLGAAVFALAVRVIPADTETRSGHFDLAGAALVTGGLVSLTYGIVRTTALGWGATGVVVPLGLAVVLLAGFLAVEHSVARSPLVPLGIFRLPQLRAANLVVLLLYAALFSMFFFVTIYMQQVLGYGALAAGAAFLPTTLSVSVGSTLAPRLVARAGVRGVSVLGMLLATAGLLLYTEVRPGGSFLADVLPGGIFAGLGMGLALVASTIAATDGVPAGQSGVASGLVNMGRLFGGALGLAVLSTIATGVSGDRPAPQALTDGFGAAFTVGAGITLAGALAALVLLRPRAAVAPADQRELAAA